MKKTVVLSCLFLFSAVCAGVLAEGETETQAAAREVKGLEWLEMPIGSRLEAVLPAMAVLQKSGVPLDGEPNDYYNLIQDFLNRRPSYYEATLTQILAQALYEKDEKARPALDRLRKRVAPKKIEMH